MVRTNQKATLHGMTATLPFERTGGCIIGAPVAEGFGGLFPAQLSRAGGHLRRIGDPRMGVPCRGSFALGGRSVATCPWRAGTAENRVSGGNRRCDQLQRGEGAVARLLPPSGVKGRVTRDSGLTPAPGTETAAGFATRFTFGLSSICRARLRDAMMSSRTELTGQLPQLERAFGLRWTEGARTWVDRHYT